MLLNTISFPNVDSLWVLNEIAKWLWVLNYFVVAHFEMAKNRCASISSYGNDTFSNFKVFFLGVRESF